MGMFVVDEPASPQARQAYYMTDRESARVEAVRCVCWLAGWAATFSSRPLLAARRQRTIQSQFDICIRIIVWLTSRPNVRDIIPLWFDSPLFEVFKGKDKACAHLYVLYPQAPRSNVHNLRGSQQLSSYLYRHSSLFPERSTRAI